MRFASMIPPSALPALFSLLVLTPTTLASDFELLPTTTTTTTACTASSTSGAFFDLRPDAAIPAKADGSRPSKSRGAPLTDYKVKGHDYGANFTLNICNAVVEPIEDVNGIAESKWHNISAYYISDGEPFSLGFQSADPITRGKELVLQYSGGSPCGRKKKSGSWGLRDRNTEHPDSAFRDYGEDEEKPPSWATNAGATGESSRDEDDEDEDEDDNIRRKSTTIFFSCDRDTLTGNAQVSFIATDPEECNYVFKVKSAHACAGVEPHKPGSVGPGSVFAIILVVAVLVYLLGGVFYNRTVGNARGWRQLPNYSMWASVWSFICDMFVVATSSCARLFPNRRGYHYLSGSPNARGRSSREDENRLIDQYDEEWED